MKTLIDFLLIFPTLLVRIILMPLKLSPKSFSSVRLLFSPTISTSTSTSIPASLPNLKELITTYCPSISSSAHYKPHPLLPSGHFQTLFSAAANTVDEDVVTYKRRVLLLPDGGTLSIDISPPELADDDLDGKIPTVVCLHGLTGGSHEACANTPVTSPQLYSASKTSDLRVALLFLTKIFPQSPMMGVGFSLGANILAKYMGEEGSQTPLRGALPIGTPFDLYQGSLALEDGLLMSKVYSKVMSSNLVKVITRHAATLVLDPNFIPRFQKLLDPNPTKEVMKERGGVKPQTLRYVDDNMTRFGGGHSEPYGEFPFGHANDYYKFGGATNFLSGVRRPLLALNADDDPIVPAHIISGVIKAMGINVKDDEKDVLEKAEQEKFEKKHLVENGNPNIVLALTKGGGHLGWWTSRKNGEGKSWKPVRWLKTPVREFSRAIFSEESKVLDQPCKDAIAWNQDGRVVEKEVEIEFLPASCLPSYKTQVGGAKANGSASQSNGSAEANGHSKEIKESEEIEDQGGIAVSGSGASRVAWLMTKLLDEAPLVHPSHAKNGWVKPADDQIQRIKVRMVSFKDYSSTRTNSDVFSWSTQQYGDSKRPEVGFYELGFDTRVGEFSRVRARSSGVDEELRLTLKSPCFFPSAGAGCTFQGGKQEPGNDGGAIDGKKKGGDLVAGL